MTLRPIADPDFWWHLKTGELISQTHAIPHTDPFSYTKAGQPWIAHEWLSELFIYGIFRLGNDAALILSFSIIITAAFIIAFFRAPRYTRPFIAGFVLLLAAISTAPTWGVRPQMFSLLLSSVFMFLLDRYRQSGSLRPLIPLPLLMVVWVNLHAGYFLGLGIIGVYILGSLAEMVLPKIFAGEQEPHVAPTLHSILVLIGALGVSILSALVNPNGIQIIFYPFQTLTSPSMQQFIQEWFSPNFHQLMWQPLAWFILLLIGFGLVSKKRVQITNVLLTIIFGYGALISMRNVPFFAIAAYPVLSELIGSILVIPNDQDKSTRIVRILGPIVVVLICTGIVFQFIRVIQSQSKTEADNFPQAAVTWLLDNKPQGNLFNSYGWGGYLIWKTYPDYRVYIDGRADVYGDSFIFNYINIYRAEPGWEDKLSNQDIRIVLVEANSPLAGMLRQNSAWKTAYTDNFSNIFTR